MFCQIIPNRVFLSIARKTKSESKKRKMLENVEESIHRRYKRSVIYNNRALFLAALRRQMGMERLWFYDCNSQWSFPPDPELKIEERHSKDKPSTQLIPQKHSYNMDETYDFFRDIYNRKSFDNRSGTVNFYSNYGRKYDNAFWDGESMVFGSGGEYFNDFGADITVVGHEFCHAVTQYSADLIYESQPGALNEHISDVFGCLIKQYLANQEADKADWLIAPGIWKTEELGSEYKALRSMKEPGTAFPEDDQPAHMDDYYEGSDDNQGVHINSGIPNKAFYLAATREGGFVWEKLGKVWYRALEDQRIVKPRSTFTEFARATLTTAKRLFPKDTELSSSIRQGWMQVGVL